MDAKRASSAAWASIAATLVASTALGADAQQPHIFHAVMQTFGCPTPEATRAVVFPPAAHVLDQAWIRSAYDQGHCVTISTKSAWKLIYVSGNVAFMSYAGTVGAPGSYYFSTALMVDAEGRHPSAIASRPPPIQPPKPVPAPEAAPRAALPPQRVAPPPPPAAPAPPAYPPTSSTTTSSNGSGGGWGVLGIICAVVIASLFRVGKSSKPVPPARSAPPPRPPPRTPAPARSAAAPAKSNARWYGPGEPVRVREMALAGGMVYVGNSLAGTSAYYGQDGCLIDPSLPVASGPAPALPYWPSYAHITPQNRYAYLAWLVGGKAQPDTEIGYVFLYFYGLERRLIADRPPQEEAGVLMAEVQRLLSIYGRNHSFHGYATRLLATARFLYSPNTISDEPNPVTDPFTVDRQAALAKLCRDRQPISFAWAALWHKEQLGNSHVWRLCPKEVLELAKLQFDAAHPNGLIHPLPASPRFTYTYAPASRSISASFDDLVKTRFGGSLPSVNGNAPAEIAKCFIKPLEDLAHYAEFLAKHPGAQESPVAVALLPSPLREARLSYAEAQFRAWADARIAPRGGLIQLDAIWVRLNGRAHWVYDKSSWEELAKQLHQCGYGLVPDPLFNHVPQATPEQQAALYRLDNHEEPRTAPSPDFATGQSAAFACAEYARISETPLSDTSVERLAEALSVLEISQAERTRILASLPWYKIQGETRGRLKKTFDHLLPSRHATVLTLAATALNVPGVDQAKLTAFLEKMSQALSVERTEVYSVLHQSADAGTPADSNVVPLRTGYAIPKPLQAARQSKKSAELDPSRIKSVLADTRDAFDALTEVFAEEDPVAPSQEPVAAGNGLDQSHASLLARLLEKPSWTWAEFDVLSHELGLMAGGALETLNEWAFDHFDEVLIEDGDPLVLSQSCVDALSAEEAASARA